MSTKPLLELAEDHGLTPELGCRSGSCGTRAVKVTAGAVTYRTPPAAASDGDKAVICRAVPALRLAARGLKPRG